MTGLLPLAATLAPLLTIRLEALVVGPLLLVAGIMVLVNRNDAARAIVDWYKTIPNRTPSWFWWHPRPNHTQALAVAVLIGIFAVTGGLVGVAIGLASLR